MKKIQIGNISMVDYHSAVIITQHEPQFCNVAITDTKQATALIAKLQNWIKYQEMEDGCNAWCRDTETTEYCEQWVR